MELITSIDFAILDFIQAAIKNFILDPVMLVLSYSGDKGAIWIIIGLIMLFFPQDSALRGIRSRGADSVLEVI